MSITVSITGAGGFIGSIMTRLFLERGDRVIAIDNYSSGYSKPLEILKKKYGKLLTIVKFDLLNGNLAQLDLSNSKLVIHLAGRSVVSESIQKPEEYFRDNLVGFLNITKVMKKVKINKLIIASSSAVYGNSQSQSECIDENHPTNPTSPYGESKLMIERILSWYGELNNFDYLIFRYFNVCGAWKRGEMGDSRVPSSAMIQNAIRGALGIDNFKLTYSIVNTPDHSPIRDYVDVLDIGRAHLQGADYLCNGGESEIINLGSGIGYSVLEILEKVENISGLAINKRTTDSRVGESDVSIACIKKANEILHWQPSISLSESISNMIKWYTHMPAGWVEK